MYGCGVTLLKRNVDSIINLLCNARNYSLLRNGYKTRIILKKTISRKLVCPPMCNPNFDVKVYNLISIDTTCENDTESKRVSRQLQKQFSCTLREAELMKTECHEFSNDINEMLRKIKFCENVGISKVDIKKNVWLLNLNERDIEADFNLLLKWNFKNTSSCICLLQLPRKKLNDFTLSLIKEREIFPELNNANRLIYLANTLKVNEKSAAELALKKQFLFTTKFSKLKEVLEVLLSYGILPQYIYSDIWIVRFNVNKMKKKLDLLLKTMEKSALRPWMLRCNETTFARTMQMRKENRAAMTPFTNSTEYLSNRLEVGHDIIEILKQKHPPLHRVQVHKLKDILDFVFSEGFTTIQVCAAPRLLCHSLNTLKERLKILQNFGYKPSSLMTLCKTQKQFSEFVGKLKSATVYRTAG